MTGEVPHYLVFQLSNCTCTDLSSYRNFFPCVFLCTLGGQQPNLMCCHNDTLACSTSRFPNCFYCLQTCSYPFPCCASNCMFTCFGIFGSQYNSPVGLVKSRLQNVNHNTSMHTEGTHTRASVIRGYFPQLLKYQGFWCISYILNKSYCISEASLDVLKFEL